MTGKYVIEIDRDGGIRRYGTQVTEEEYRGYISRTFDKEDKDDPVIRIHVDEDVGSEYFSVFFRDVGGSYRCCRSGDAITGTREEVIAALKSRKEQLACALASYDRILDVLGAQDDAPDIWDTDIITA